MDKSYLTLTRKVNAKTREVVIPQLPECSSRFKPMAVSLCNPGAP